MTIDIKAMDAAIQAALDANNKPGHGPREHAVFIAGMLAAAEIAAKFAKPRASVAKWSGDQIEARIRAAADALEAGK